MKIQGLMISQKSEQGKTFQIYMTKMNIFDLRNYVYVKRIKEDYQGLGDDKNGIDIFSGISGVQGEDISNNRLEEVQRELKTLKIKGVKEYLQEDLGIFPSSVLLGTKIKDNFIKFTEKGNIYEIEFFPENNKEGFFIIDGQHRIYGLLNYFIEKIKGDFNNYIFEKNDNLSLSEYIDYLFNTIKEKDQVENFIKNNQFELPIVIMHEISINRMVELFADINTKSTKLDNDFSTYIYGVATDKDLEKKIFVTIGEKLNNNINSPLYDRIKLPYDLYDNDGKLLKNSRGNFSKISINPFFTNSKNLLSLDGLILRSNYLLKPFNLLLDNFIKDSEYTDYNSPETLSFVINGIIILYYSIYNNIKKVYGEDKYNDDEFKFISSSNHFMYLEIIRIITVKLFLQSNTSDDFIDLFSNPKIIDHIDNIFEKNIKTSLKNLFNDYQYFKEGSLKGTGGITGTNIKNQFKIHYYQIGIEQGTLIGDLTKDRQKIIKDNIKNKENEFINIINNKLLELGM